MVPKWPRKAIAIVERGNCVTFAVRFQYFVNRGKLLATGQWAIGHNFVLKPFNNNKDTTVYLPQPRGTRLFSNSGKVGRQYSTTEAKFGLVSLWPV